MHSSPYLRYRYHRCEHCHEARYEYHGGVDFEGHTQSLPHGIVDPEVEQEASHEGDDRPGKHRKALQLQWRDGVSGPEDQSDHIQSEDLRRELGLHYRDAYYTVGDNESINQSINQPTNQSINRYHLRSGRCTKDIHRHTWMMILSRQYNHHSSVAETQYLKLSMLRLSPTRFL